MIGDMSTLQLDCKMCITWLTYNKRILYQAYQEFCANFSMYKNTLKLISKL